MQVSELTTLLTATTTKMLSGVEDARRRGVITQSDADRLLTRCAELLESLPSEDEAKWHKWHHDASITRLFVLPSADQLSEHSSAARLSYISRMVELGQLGQLGFPGGDKSWWPDIESFFDLKTRYLRYVLDPTVLKLEAVSPQATVHYDMGNKAESVIAEVSSPMSAEGNDKQRLRERTAELRRQFAADLERLHELGKP
jgi:hypothetical protein